VTGADLDNASGKAPGIRWNLRDGSIDAKLSLTLRPTTANASGWMVGTGLQGHGLLQADNRNVTLPDIFGQGSNPMNEMPLTLSDDARTIAGQAGDAAGVTHAVIWRCD